MRLYVFVYAYICDYMCLYTLTYVCLQITSHHINSVNVTCMHEKKYCYVFMSTKSKYEIKKGKDCWRFAVFSAIIWTEQEKSFIDICEDLGLSRNHREMRALSRVDAILDEN